MHFVLKIIAVTIVVNETALGQADFPRIVFFAMYAQW